MTDDEVQAMARFEGRQVTEPTTARQVIARWQRHTCDEGCEGCRYDVEEICRQLGIDPDADLPEGAGS